MKQDIRLVRTSLTQIFTKTGSPVYYLRCFQIWHDSMVSASTTDLSGTVLRNCILTGRNIWVRFLVQSGMFLFYSIPKMMLGHRAPNQI